MTFECAIKKAEEVADSFDRLKEERIAESEVRNDKERSGWGH